jgi:hypothetical protein
MPKLALSMFAILAVAATFATAVGQQAPSPVPSPSSDAPASVPQAVPASSPGAPPSQTEPAPRAVLTPSDVFPPLQNDLRSNILPPVIEGQPDGARYVVNPVFRERTAFEPFAEEESLRAQSQELARALESERVGSPKYEAVKTQLRDLLSKQFDKRQARHKNQIEALEAQVKKLREVVQKRQENREDIVSRRLDLIIRESQGLGF